MIRPRRSPRRPTSKVLKLGAMRAVFALGGRFAPRQTVERAARLFATPYGSSRSRARAVQAGSTKCSGTRSRRDSRPLLHTFGATLLGSPTPFSCMVGRVSDCVFLPGLHSLRQAGFAVVTFDQPGHGYSTGELCTLPDFINTIHAIGRHYGCRRIGRRAFAGGRCADARTRRELACRARCRDRSRG